MFFSKCSESRFTSSHIIKQAVWRFGDSAEIINEAFSDQALIASMIGSK